MSEQNRRDSQKQRAAGDPSAPKVHVPSADDKETRAPKHKWKRLVAIAAAAMSALRRTKRVVIVADRGIRRSRPWLEIFALAGALTGLYLFYDQNRLMLESNNLTRRAVDISQRTMEITQRARVSVAEMTPVDLTAADLSFFVVIRNSGSLPANNIRIKANTEPRAAPLPGTAAASVSLDKDSISQAVLAPDQPGRLPVYARGGGFKPADLVVLRSGAHRYYVYGRIAYFDGFRTRATGFCGVLDPRTGEWHYCLNNNWAE